MAYPEAATATSGLRADKTPVRQDTTAEAGLRPLPSAPFASESAHPQAITKEIRSTALRGKFEYLHSQRQCPPQFRTSENLTESGSLVNDATESICYNHRLAPRAAPFAGATWESRVPGGL